jgi:hypothetical protein
MAKGEAAQVSQVLSNFPVGSVSFVRGPAMDTRRSFYLASREDDFAEPAADASRLDFNDIPFIMPANDNLRTKDRWSARRGNCPTTG